MLRKRCIVVNAYIRKMSQVCNSMLTPHVTKKNEEKNKLITGREKEIINIGRKINESEKRKTIGKINETKIYFFEKIN